MREPTLLKHSQILIKNFGIIKVFFHRIGLIKISDNQIKEALVKHREQIWLQWVDWRWNNATLMAGSYDKMHLTHKVSVMDRCYEKGIEFGIDISYISDFLNSNGFGWKTPQKNNAVCQSNNP